MAVINVLVVVFVLFMAYWWSAQGLFSSLLHLLAVIVAGSLAFALWEPLTAGLMGWATAARFAWGAVLIISFVTFLLLIRIASDKLIGRNMFFRPIVNTAGGAAIGLFSGALTAGITVLGISFMGVGPEFGGYQPLVVEKDGTVKASEAGGTLWIGVDSMAASFFAGLSAGPFCSNTPMAKYQPDLLQQAGLFRLHTDVNASVVALPETVEVTDLLIQPTPVSATDTLQRQVIGSYLGVADKQAVIILTKWTQKYPTYDSDNTLRVAPMQIRLIASNTDSVGDDVKLIAPIAGIKVIGPTAPRQFYLFNDVGIYLSGVSNSDVLGWVFVIEKNEKPEFLLARHTRLALPPKSDDDAGNFVKALGNPSSTAKASASSGGSGVAAGTVTSRTGTRTGSQATEVVVSDELPKRVSRNMMPTTVHLDGSGKIEDGNGLLRVIEGRLSQENEVKQIAAPSHMRIVRVELSQDRAQTFLGKAMALAANVSPPMLTDSNGNVYTAFGYDWLQSNGEQTVYFDDIQGVKSAKELPANKMGADDFIYLYFKVPKGVNIIQYQVGDTKQQCNVAVGN